LLQKATATGTGGELENGSMLEVPLLVIEAYWSRTRCLLEKSLPFLVSGLRVVEILMLRLADGLYLTLPFH